MQHSEEPPELSVVIPCLNEAETLGVCVRKALQGIRDAGIVGEVIVADNGSTDGSQEISIQAGARVVSVLSKGYGNALMGGISAARGRFVLMGDADDSYDFLEIPKFVTPLNAGYDLVQGCRLPSGGGTVMSGAMPFLHRWLGNPVLSWLARWWFRVPIHDIYCGMRGFTKAHYERLAQRCTGMEFATEMIIKSSLVGARIAEVPITLHPDGRTLRTPHLKTFRDGWRTLRYFLMSSPRWLFLMPGAFLMLLGFAGYAIVLPRISLFGIQPDAHALLFASVAILCGYQAALFALFTKTFAVNEGLLPPDTRLSRFFLVVNLERGLLLAVAALCFGLFLLVHAFVDWHSVGYGRLDYSSTMRWVIPGATITALAFQTILSSFFVSILSMTRK